MMSKGQGLPMSTIALVIIILLTIAAVAFFFFSRFGMEESGVGAADCQQKCRSVQVAVESAGANAGSAIASLNKANSYCENCPDQKCAIERANGTSCTLNPCNSTGCYNCTA